MLRHRLATVAAVAMASGSAAWAEDYSYFEPKQCALPSPVVNKVLGQLASVVKLSNGGLFSPNLMWAAVVDRQGVLCGVTRSDPDAWPGSRDIAIAKANDRQRVQQWPTCPLDCQPLRAHAAGWFVVWAEQLEPV